MARPGVIAVGEGRREGRPCVLVFASIAAGQSTDLPASIEGYPVVIEPTGPFTAPAAR